LPVRFVGALLARCWTSGAVTVTGGSEEVPGSAADCASAAFVPAAKPDARQPRVRSATLATELDRRLIRNAYVMTPAPTASSRMREGDTLLSMELDGERPALAAAKIGALAVE
jgi:hypothetical protein